MIELIENFNKQLEEGIAIGEKSKLTKSKKAFKNIIISGMGGSGIAGSIVSEIASKYSTVPIILNKDYGLPNFADSNSLVIISSYSGNTEETISSLLEARKKKAKIVCITSGGKIIDIAKKEKIDHIIVPSGMAPRATLGYGFVQQLYVFNFFGIIPNTFKKDLKNSIKLIEEQKENIKKEAKEVAQFLYNKTPIIYTSKPFEGVAVRFKQQLNENSKVSAWYGVIPEMNHNELLGWSLGKEYIAPIFFRNDIESIQNKKRVEVSKQVISEKTQIKEIWTKGKSIIEKTIYFIHLGDFVSVYLADLNKVDADEMEVIENLKKVLVKK